MTEARELSRWFKALVALQGTQVQFPALHSESQPSVTSVPKDPVPSSDLGG